MGRSAGFAWLSAGLVLLLGGCRSASEGSYGGDVARVASDVRRRVGVPVDPESGPAAEAAVKALLAAPLTESSVVKVALLRNAGIRATYERLGVARAHLLQAGLLANPVFAVNVKSFTPGTEVEWALAASFVDLFFVPLRRTVAAYELQATEAHVARDVVHWAFEARRALAAVRGAEDVVRLREEARVAVTAARDLMKRLHEAGGVRDADLRVEEIGAARADLSLEAARVRVREARETLSVWMGLRAGGGQFTVEGSLGPPPASDLSVDLEARALAASLDLLEEKARAAAALEASGLARGEGILPMLDLGIVGKREAEDGAFGIGPSLSTAIPIFDHGQARVLAACAEAREHLARHEQAAVEVASAARRLAARARALRERERTLRETYLPLRAKYVDDTVQAFNAMQIGAFDVLDAKEGEADARRERAETALAAWIARIDLEELLAGSLPRERLATPELPDDAERPAPPKGH